MRVLFLSCLFSCFFLSASAQLRQVHVNTNEDNDLRKMSFYSGSHGYVAFRDWIGFTTDSGRTFTQKPITLTNVNFNGYPANVTFGFGIAGVKAFNQDTVIAYGDYGLVPSILYSTDGANTFKLVYHSQFNPTVLRTGVMDMEFHQNGATGWAVDADRVLKTTDKGLTWNYATIDQGRFFHSIQVLDNSTIFAISEGRVRRTFNGGSTWTILPLPIAGDINYAYFLSSSKGWLNIETADGGVLYYTSNSAATWTAKTDLTIEPFSCIKMHFRNDSVGYAVVEDHYATYKTTDSGRIWERLPRDNNFSYLYYNHEVLHFRSDNQFWVGGDYGFLELTTNAGGIPLPSARFKIDTTNVYSTNTVNLLNYSKPGYQYNWYVNNTFVGSTTNASYTHDIYRPFDTIKLIISNGIHSDTAIKVQAFNAVPYPPPVVTSYTPGTGGTGTVVTITGNFFVNVTAVTIGGIPVSSYSVNSINQIVATVGEGANGNVSVTTVKGTGSLPGYIFYPPPIISSFAPLQGPIGAAVTINGSNFNTTPANNIVYFGSVKANVQSASSNQLVVTVPIGAAYAPISVTVNKHVGYSSSWFSVTFPSTCGFSEYTFALARFFPMAQGALTASGATRISDLDGDGRNDIATTTVYGFSALRNTGSSGYVNFAPEQWYHAGPAVYGLDVGDLDGDSKPDVVVSCANSDTISIYKNTSTPGTISFAPRTYFRLIGARNQVTITDLDLDGKCDLIVAVAGNTRVISIYRNITINGNINFMPKQDFEVGVFVSKISAGDLDRDGKPDLVMVDGGIFSSNQHTFTIYRNTSSIGTISLERQVVSHWSASYMDNALFDADGDGKLDVGVIYDTRYSIGTPPSTAIYKNTSTPGTISLAAPVTFAGQPYPRWITAGDIDGNGKIDIDEGCSVNNVTQLFRNKTTGGTISMDLFTPPQILMNTGMVSIGDMDGDGKPDLMTSGSGIAVYRNLLGVRGAWAGMDTSICNGQSITLGKTPQIIQPDNHTYSWTSSPAGFTSSLSKPVVSPTVSTAYYLAVTDASGCIHYDTINVGVGAAPSVLNAGRDTTICAGAPVQIGTPAVSGYTYSWKQMFGPYTSTVANPIINPTASGTYILSVNTGVCIATDTVIVSVNPYPFANAGPDKYVCIPTGTSVGAPGPGHYYYNWSSDPPGFTSSMPNPSVFPTVTTKYFLIVSVNGCTSYDTVVVAAYPSPPKPVVTASGPLSFCSGGSVTLTSSVTTNIQWYKDGLSITGATNPNLVVTQGGNYYVYSTLGFCLNVSTTTAVTVTNPPSTPTITAGGAVSFCEGGSVTLTSTANSGNQWYKDGVAISGAINKTYIASQSGSYTAAATISGCSSATSAAIVVTAKPIPTPPVITANGPTEFCNGGSVALTSSDTSNFVSWYRDNQFVQGIIGGSFSATLSGTYRAKVLVNNCLSGFSNAIVVTANPVTPTISAMDSLSFCNGDSVILSSSIALGNQWYKDGAVINGATNQTYTATQSGSYTVRVTTGNCTSQTSNALVVSVGAAPPTISVIGSLSICNGESVGLRSSSALGNQWYKDGVLITGATNQTYVTNLAGSYTVRVAISNCPPATSTAAVVIVNPIPAAPSITTTGSLTFCNGDSVVLTSSAGSANQWYRNAVAINGATSQTYSATQAGTYSVRTTVNGCTSLISNAVNVTVTPRPPAPGITQIGDSLQTTGTSGIQWYLNGNPIPGATGPVHKPTVSGLYTVRVTVNGCESPGSAALNFVITAVVSPNLDRFISITPNPTNDKVGIKYSGNFGRFVVSVSDMSGKLLFTSDLFSTTYDLYLKKYSSGPYIINIVNTKTGERVHRVVIKL